MCIGEVLPFIPLVSMLELLLVLVLCVIEAEEEDVELELVGVWECAEALLELAP